MGLAASQARFLLLSSRQSDVELRMQSITSQKLALQRQSGDIATKYQRALNTSNLCWNDNKVNYDTITNPSSSYMLTNSYGAVVLDGDLAGLLEDPSLPASGSGADFEALYPDEEKFLKAISSSGITTEDAQIAISENREAQIAQKDYDETHSEATIAVNYSDAAILKQAQLEEVYNDNTAVDLLTKANTSITNKETTNAKLFGDWVSSVKAEIGDITSYGDAVKAAGDTCRSIIEGISNNLANGYEQVLCYGTDGVAGPMAEHYTIVQSACEYAKQATLNQYLYGYYDTDASSFENEAYAIAHPGNETTNTTDQIGTYNFSELSQDPLYGDETHVDKSRSREDEKDLNTIDFIANSDTAKTNWFVKLFNGQKDATATAYFNIYPSQIIDTYMNYFDMYLDAHCGHADGCEVGTPNKTEIREDYVKKHYTDSEYNNEKNRCYNELKTSFTWVYSGEVDTSNYTRTMVPTYDTPEKLNAAVEEEMDKWHSDHSTIIDNALIGYTSERREYGGTDSTAYATTASSNATAKAQYYMKLYNALCSSGWVTDEKVDDSDYLENQLMYGNYVVGNMTSYTNYYELAISDSSSPFTIEDDKDAAERAKVEYEAERDEIDYKEALLDAQLDSLSTEREEIMTEKDGVQELINENVKIFKLFA